MSVKTTLLSINVSYSDFVEAGVNLSVISIENFFSEAKCPNPAMPGYPEKAQLNKKEVQVFEKIFITHFSRRKETGYEIIKVD